MFSVSTKGLLQGLVVLQGPVRYCIYKISVRYSTKDKIQTNNCFDFLAQNVSRKIGGGKHVEKIEMDIISAFIVNAPPNISDIEMCEFIDHLETSECLKKYQSSDHL